MAEPERVVIHISHEQRRLLLAGLPPSTAASFTLDRAGSFTLPTLLPHVTFVPVLNPAALENIDSCRTSEKSPS